METASSGRCSNTGWRSSVPGTDCGDGVTVSVVGLTDGISVVVCWIRSLIECNSVGSHLSVMHTFEERLHVDSVVCLSVLSHVGCTNGFCVGILASRICVTISFRAHPPTRRGSVRSHHGSGRYGDTVPWYTRGYARSAGLGRFGDTTEDSTWWYKAWPQVLVGLLVSTCLPSGALVPKRHTCVNFVVSNGGGPILRGAARSRTLQEGPNMCCELTWALGLVNMSS